MDSLAPLVAAPDDDAPRLVHADWLLERGDPRGEFIQLQCELERRLPRARRRELRRRADALLDEHRTAWEAPVRRLPAVTRGSPLDPLPAVLQATFRRGFIESLELPFLDYAAHAAELVQAAPLLRSLVLREVPRDAAIAALPWPRHLRELRADAERPWLERFFACPAGTGIRRLTVYLDPERLAWLLGFEGLGALDALRTVATAAAAQELAARLPSLPALRELEVVGLRSRDPTWPADSLSGLLEKTPGLRRLTIRDLAIGDAGAAAIARSGLPLTALGLLAGSGWPLGLGVEGVSALAASGSLRGLERLWLTAWLGAPELRALRAAFPEADVSLGGTVFGLAELRVVGDWVVPQAFAALAEGRRPGARPALARDLSAFATPRAALEEAVRRGLLDAHWLEGNAFRARSWVPCASCGGSGMGDAETTCYAAECSEGRVPRFQAAAAPEDVAGVVECARDPDGLRAVTALARELGQALARWTGTVAEARLSLRLGRDAGDETGFDDVLCALRHTRVLAGQERLSSRDPDWLPRALATFILAEEAGEAVQGAPPLDGQRYAAVPNPFALVGRARELGYGLRAEAPGELVIEVTP